MNSLIIDDFLPYPHVVRSWALVQDFYNAEEFSNRIGSHTSWPGTRTDHVMDLDLAYADSVLTQVSAIIRRTFVDLPLSIKSYFQICTSADGDSWVHQDNDVDIAGILYLTPGAPVASGTTVYRCNDLARWQNMNIADMKRINRHQLKFEYEQLFTPVDVIGNIFNRLVLYRGDQFHKSNDYFGKTKQDARLTQVFFAKVDRGA
jgi:hypothetical protein